MYIYVEWLDIFHSINTLYRDIYIYIHVHACHTYTCTRILTNHMHVLFMYKTQIPKSTIHMYMYTVHEHVCLYIYYVFKNIL